MNRLVTALTLLALVGCSQGDTPPTKPVFRVAQAEKKDAMPVFGLVTAGAAAGTAYEARIRGQRTFARLPDRGELLSYPSRGSSHGAVVQGAYTWHRVDVSEEHALRAIIDGHLRVLTPSGQMLDIRYDRHIEHPSGDLSWIGHIEGEPGAQTVLTFGADAVYGSIGQPGKRSLRLTTRNGAGWIVETDPSKLVGIASAGAHPHKPDALAIPKVRANSNEARFVPAPVVPKASATAAAATRIDVLVGYTQGFAAAQGGASSVMTRLNYLVTVSNEAFANSQINAQIRLVHAMQVNYTDDSTNESTLEQLTGYDSSSEDYTTPNAAFNALRAARETYGADLVTLVRDFRDPEQNGCGIAWLIGGGLSGVSPGDGQDYFGYSVVSDGQDENGGSTYFCRDETMIHELAHNMGSQHDRGSADGDNGQLEQDEYGAFQYSFGLKSAGGNFYTIMAYGESGQTDYRVFSNPRISFCGGVCGTASYEDNARSLAQLTPVIAQFRNTVVPVAGGARNDINGDGRSDILFRNATAGLLGWWEMNGTSVSATRNIGAGSGYTLSATGDFNGDNRTDLLWSNSARRLVMFVSTGATFTSTTISEDFGAGWSVAGAGDINGDGTADILFRNTSAQLVGWWLMNGTARLSSGSQGAGSAYALRAAADFSGDGRLDLAWTTASRKLVMFISSGNAFTSSTITSDFGAGWSLVSAGDVNGDGYGDLIFRNTSGALVGWWTMRGASKLGSGSQSAGSAYTLSAMGDFNGDGRADLVWTSSARRLIIFQSTGAAFTSSTIANDFGAGWTVVNGQP